MSLSTRSWTDAVTNAALFARFDAAEYFAWLSGRGIRVDRALTQFLHEFTHHWCFDSIVGSAIAALTLRARRNAHVYSLEGRFDLILGDVMRLGVVETMLQPLSEGLALFAEFDMAPGAGEIESQTTTSCLICFGFAVRAEQSEKTASIVTRGLQQTMRRRRETLERKAGVYAGLFECAEGYLAGYLAVKTLWTWCGKRAPLLHDADQFLSFLRSWIYSDAGLAVLLAEDGDDDVACYAIAERIRERISGLTNHPDLAATVDRWSQAVLAGTSVLPGLDVDEATLERAAEAVFLTLTDVQDGGDIEQFATHAWMTLEERGFVTLGSLEAIGTVRHGQIVVTLPALPDTRFDGACDWSDATHGGEFVAVTSSRWHCVVAAFVADGRTCIVQTFGETSAIDAQALDRYLVNRAISTSVHADIEASLAAALAQPDLAERVERLRAIMLDHTESLYGTLATLLVAAGDKDQVLSLLREGGILALLGGDAALLRGLAAIGLANTSGIDDATLAIWAGVYGLPDGSIERVVAEASERHGMPLVVRPKENATIALV